MRKQPLIFIHGGDGFGWSIDADRRNVEMLLTEAGFKITKNPFSADIIHFVWWDQLYKFRRFRCLSKAKWLATVTNTIDVKTRRFEDLRNIVDLWVAASRSQFDWLKQAGVNTAYQPFFVDEAIFRPLENCKSDLCHQLGLDIDRLTGKVLIGSFQRDTTADLISPKWQKGPDFLIEVLRNITIPKKDWCLILAGPRRHWIIDQCKAHGIPYVFVGKLPESGVDDISVNTLSPETMAKLYNLVDIYIISSEREGGPKAVMESILCGTPLISRPVGLAQDMMCSNGIYSSVAEGCELISKLMTNDEIRKDLSLCNSMKAKPILGRANAVERWLNIYKNISGKPQ